MDSIDSTQSMLRSYLSVTEEIMNNLLEKPPYYGCAKIICNLDLGFPHDVIRLAGGFATGICVCWETKKTFVPVDICMNACTVSLYELTNNEIEFFNEDRIKLLIRNLNDSSYKANFHRGNHFISLLEDIKSKKNYLMIHSSAAEFETMYNGLYPVENNYIFENIKIYYSHGRYIRYIDGKIADLYLKLADSLYKYNENRHDFIIASLLGKLERVKSINHYHHYGMPCAHIALLGSHMIQKGQITPLLTRPGENVYLLKYYDVLDDALRLPSDKEYFITPHGWGKCHTSETKIEIDCENKIMQLDSLKYKIRYGESLREHPGLELRNIQSNDYFSYFSKAYEYSIFQEFKQLSSYNKNGFIKWV